MGYSRWCIHWVNAELLICSLGTTVDNHCPKTYDLLTIKDNHCFLWLSLWIESRFLFLPIFGSDFCFQNEVEIARIVGADSEGEIVWVLNAEKSRRNEYICNEKGGFILQLFWHAPSPAIMLGVLFLYIFFIWLKIHAKMRHHLNTGPVALSVWVG